MGDQNNHLFGLVWFGLVFFWGGGEQGGKGEKGEGGVFIKKKALLETLFNL